MMLAATVVVAACHGGNWNRGSAWLRNESSASVQVSIAYRREGILGGTDEITLDVPPWREGWCYAMGRGINPGDATISVSGSSVPFPITTTVTVPNAPDDKISVLIDPSGEVHFSRDAPPPIEEPCFGYGQEPEPSSP